MTNQTFAKMQAAMEAFDRRLDRLEAHLRLLRPEPDDVLGARDLAELLEAIR